MNLAQLRQCWWTFWFKPQSAIPIAIARILFGLLLIQFGLLLAPEIHPLLGPQSILPAIKNNAWWGTPAFSVLDYLPDTNESLDFILVIFLLAAIMLTLGICSRPSALIAFVILSSFYARNIYIFGASDFILRVVTFLLIFAPTGEALSIKRLTDIWLKKSFSAGPPPLVNPWSLRLVQIHFALVWWIGFSRKLHGEEWMNGTAIYYVNHFRQLVRYPLPFLPDNLLTSKLLTWSTLFIEFSLAILIWIKEFRLPLIMIGIIFHLALDWSLWLQQFEYVMIAGLISFVEPATFSKFATFVRQAARRLGLSEITALYNQSNDFSARLAETIRRLDILRLVTLSNDSSVGNEIVIYNDGILKGTAAWNELSLRLPALIVFHPITKVLCQLYPAS